MGNRFCHLELTTDNVAGAKEFYTKLFDWKLSEYPSPDMPYTMIDTGQEPGGGMMSLPDPQVPVCWTMYVEVADVAATCAKVRELGGQVEKGPEDIPGVGTFAIVGDPQGAVFGIWASVQG
jgi:predicted enzyme related to lactoylglutathione lyase